MLMGLQDSGSRLVIMESNVEAVLDVESVEVLKENRIRMIRLEEGSVGY